MKMEDRRPPRPTLKDPRVRRSLDQFDRFSDDVRAEILGLIKTKYVMTASPEMRAWLRELGNPDRRRFVLSVVKKAAKAAK